MDIKKLQKKVDKALMLLSDHDDKKEQERYHNLRNKIEECQDYIDIGNHSNDLSLELYTELKKCMKEFEEDRLIFIIFLIILCGLLFIGVFYITYSHMHDHWHPNPGGNIRPPHHTKTKKTSSTTKTITTNKVDESSTTKTTSTTTKTTQVTTVDKTDTTTTVTTIITTKPSDDEEPTNAFVYLTFDNSALIDLENVYPMLDSNGIKTKPTTWSLSSKLENGSKDYILYYYIDFKDKLGNVGEEKYIPENERLDVNKLKYQLLIKRKGTQIFDSGIQDMYDYPEAEEGIRPIISGQTMNNDETLDFELRMWLDSATGNDQQGKSYRFEIDVTYNFEFID